MKVLFVAGFGPIVKDEKSKQFYRYTLKLPLVGEDYLNTNQIEGVKELLFGLFLKQPNLVLAQTNGQKTSLFPKRG